MGDGTAASNLDDSRTYQLVDNVTWNHGKHALTFGGDIRHVQDDATTDNTPYGSISFSGAETGNAAADFMLGVPSSLITPEGVPLSMSRQWRDYVYVQDNWKVNSNLTMNLGIRWDIWVQPHDNLNTSRTLNWNTNPPTLVNLPVPLWKISHKDFSPRLGFAYSLPDQFVLRGAYGITFYGGQFDNINILQLNPPTDPSFSLSNGTTPSNPPTATINNPVSPSITPASANVASLPIDDRHPDLYLQTYNLTLSKQFWSNVIDVSYVGVKGTHQDTSIPYFNNGPPQPASGSVNADRPFPTFGNIRLLDFHGASDYNGLEVHFQHKFSHNLEFTTAYAFSHLLDNQGGDTNGSRNETQIPASKEWANGLTDQRQNLTIAMVWALPKLSGGNFAAREVLNGWGINTIFQFIAGSPVFVTQSQDGENNGNAYERPDLVPGQSLTVAHRLVSQWFNTAAFTEAIGHYGSTPRNPAALVGPSVDPLTLAIRRSFAMPFKEPQHLDVRLEAFNVLFDDFAAQRPEWKSGLQHLRDNYLNQDRQPRDAVGSEIYLLVVIEPNSCQSLGGRVRSKCDAVTGAWCSVVRAGFEWFGADRCGWRTLSVAGGVAQSGEGPAGQGANRSWRYGRKNAGDLPGAFRLDGSADQDGAGGSASEECRQHGRPRRRGDGGDRRDNRGRQGHQPRRGAREQDGWRSPPRDAQGRHAPHRRERAPPDDRCAG